MRWKGPLCTIIPPQDMMPAVTRTFDFYQMRGDKIFYNWMITDTVDLMLQAGYRVLPKVVLTSIMLPGSNFDFSLHYKRAT